MKTMCDTCEFMIEVDRGRDRVKCEPNKNWHYTALYGCVLKKKAEKKKEKNTLVAFLSN